MAMPSGRKRLLMDSRVRMIAAAAVVGVASLASGSAAASTSAVTASPGSHTWGAAEEVPGTAALNRGGGAGILSMSCASAGNCSAGGNYLDSSGHGQAFVVSQINGIWHTAIEAPGTAALGGAVIASVSCASAGNCSAGGYYTDSSGREQAFVASQVNGTWHSPIEVPGTAALNRGGAAQILSVSCAAAGNCSAGGFYTVSSGDDQAFVVSQVNGTWHTAIEVPGTAALNRAGFAGITSVSCAAAGNCSAGGNYKDSSGHGQVFVASQVNGRWHTAIEVPGTAALNRGGRADLTSVSCGAAGNCSAGGAYAPRFRHSEPFVVSQANGTWHTAIEVPGAAALNQSGHADVTSVSCAGAGSCSAGGFYTDSSVREQVFVASQVNGTWQTAIEVPGTAALNRGGDAYIASVSCGAVGNCSAGGFYTDSSGHQQAFVASET
jgi:hypothetical protein